MSLPQRKKSAEEIAKLREALGVPVTVEDAAGGPSEAEPETPANPEPSSARDAEVVQESNESDAAAELIAPIPAPAPQEPKLVRSLRRSERLPVLPVTPEGRGESADETDAGGSKLPEKVTLPDLHGVRAARSLRKSEQVPVIPAARESAASKLPTRRHSDREINEIRRHEALTVVTPPRSPRMFAAPFFVVIPGYLAAIVGGACFTYFDLEKRFFLLTASCAVIALVIASYLLIRRPLSRHHGAFISVLAMFVIVFGALYYFPQLHDGP